jgi:hypothetical protein
VRFEIIVSVSGGVTGNRSAVLKSDGKPRRFATRAEADAAVAKYLRDMNGPYATAAFGAHVVEVEDVEIVETCETCGETAVAGVRDGHRDGCPEGFGGEIVDDDDCN